MKRNVLKNKTQKGILKTTSLVHKFTRERDSSENSKTQIETEKNLVAGGDGGVIRGRRDAVSGVTHDGVRREDSLSRTKFHGSIFE